MAEQTQKPKNKGGRPKGKRPPIKPSVSLKGSEEWRKWLEELAHHVRLPMTYTIDQALMVYAEAMEFKKHYPGR